MALAGCLTDGPLAAANYFLAEVAEIGFGLAYVIIYVIYVSFRAELQN